MKETATDTENLELRKVSWILCPSACIHLVLVSGNKLGEKMSISLVMSLDIVVWRNKMVSQLGPGMWSRPAVGGVFSYPVSIWTALRQGPSGSLPASTSPTREKVRLHSAVHKACGRVSFQKEQKSVGRCVQCMDAGVLPVGSQAGIVKPESFTILLEMEIWTLGHPLVSVKKMVWSSRAYQGKRKVGFRALILLHLGDGEEECSWQRVSWLNRERGLTSSHLGALGRVTTLPWLLGARCLKMVPVCIPAVLPDSGTQTRDSCERRW